MTDLVKLYNPASASSLTPEQLSGLQKLSSAEIKELAQAYPNMTMQRAYLLIIDGSKPAEKQTPTLSTFENLWNLREKNGQRNYVAFAFKGTYKPKTNAPFKPARREVVDLSDTELMTLPGFKTATSQHAPQEVKVTKVQKTEAPEVNSNSQTKVVNNDGEKVLNKEPEKPATTERPNKKSSSKTKSK